MTKRVCVTLSLMLFAAAALAAPMTLYENDFESEDSVQGIKGAERVAEGKDSGHAAKVASSKHYASMDIRLKDLQVTQGMVVSFDYKLEGDAGSLGVRIHMGNKTKVGLHGKGGAKGWNRFEAPATEFRIAKMSKTKEKFAPGDSLDRLEIYGRAKKKENKEGEVSHALLVDNLRITIKR